MLRLRARKRYEIVLSVLRKYAWLFADEPSIDVLTLNEMRNTLVLRGRISLVSGGVFEFRISQSPMGVSYSYHLMDEHGNVIFRYDNAPHHPEIETFPHHKHTPSGIEPTSEPSFANVMQEITTRMEQLSG